jgi:hypothetical protein
LTAAELAEVETYLQEKYFGPPNTAPAINITGPANGSTYEVGTLITFTAGAVDVEQGDLSSVIQWSSDRTGPLGSGASIDISTLAVGPHVITASVTDSGNLVATATINLTITGPNTPPVVNITAPASGGTVSQQLSHLPRLPAIWSREI